MLNRLYGWYGKRVVLSVIGALVFIVVVGIFIRIKTTDTTLVDAVEKQQASVTVQSVSTFGIQSTFSVIGVVRAVSEAKLQTEASGRITSVNVSVGDSVNAGTILASLENSAERAQLLQAEGAYESALASSLQSGASLEEAKVSVRNIYRDTYSNIDNVVRNLTDDFFMNPSSPNRGFRLGSTGKTTEFNKTRGEIEVLLTDWAKHIATNYEGMTEAEMLSEAEAGVTLVSNFTAGLALIISDYDADLRFTDEALASYKVRLAGARASLDGSLAAISGVRQGYEQAMLTAASDTASQSSALLKSALGSLRGAQSRYEKTLVRTPIRGVVNALYLKEGDYASMGMPAAIVANNGSLEISASLGEKDLEHITVGDTVRVNNATNGTIVNIAPAVDPLTGKSEVKITIDEDLSLKNGSTVSVAFSSKVSAVEESTSVIVPLKALKLLASGSVAFGVNEQNTLIAYPVELGAIIGDSVEILSGLTPETKIVTDARGLKEGDVVQVIQN